MKLCVFILKTKGLLRDDLAQKVVSASNFALLQEQFCYDARVLIDMMEIPGSLVIN